MGSNKTTGGTSYPKRKAQPDGALPSGVPRSTSPPLRADSRIVVPFHRCVPIPEL